MLSNEEMVTKMISRWLMEVVEEQTLMTELEAVLDEDEVMLLLEWDEYILISVLSTQGRQSHFKLKFKEITRKKVNTFFS